VVKYMVHGPCGVQNLNAVRGHLSISLRFSLFSSTLFYSPSPSHIPPVHMYTPTLCTIPRDYTLKANDSHLQKLMTLAPQRCRLV
jgi:hypothetical protein